MVTTVAVRGAVVSGGRHGMRAGRAGRVMVVMMVRLRIGGGRRGEAERRHQNRRQGRVPNRHR
jgi:hypothetical protein